MLHRPSAVFFAASTLVALAACTASPSDEGPTDRGAVGSSNTSDQDAIEPEADSPADAAAATAPAPATDAGVGSPLACATTAPIDATGFAYTKGRARSPGACSRADIDALVAYERAHAQAGLRVDEWRATVSARCSACAFSEVGDALAAPLVTSGNELVRVNLPGCYEVVSGKVECGRRFSQLQQCVDEACGTCTDPAQNQACRWNRRIVEAACGAAMKTRDEACAGDRDVAWACTGRPPLFFDAVTHVCGGAP